MDTTWIALYRGATVRSAQLIAVSADPGLVADVAARVLDTGDVRATDPVLSPLARGRRASSRAIRDEASVRRRSGRLNERAGVDLALRR